jgi:hypothetical protein
MKDCNHSTVKINWFKTKEVKPGIVILSGVCDDCGDHVKTKLERTGTVSRSDFYMEGLEAFD